RHIACDYTLACVQTDPYTMSKKDTQFRDAPLPESHAVYQGHEPAGSRSISSVSCDASLLNSKCSHANVPHARKSTPRTRSILATSPCGPRQACIWYEYAHQR